jgi:hypothetical protein
MWCVSCTVLQCVHACKPLAHAAQAWCFKIAHCWLCCCCAANYHVCLQDIKFAVHAHPTLSEVLDELIKSAHVDPPSSSSNSSTAKAGAKQPVAA